jgi:hypothetical protein
VPPGDTLTLTTWRERNRHALREFWVRAPADALGVKQEFEKTLAQDGKISARAKGTVTTRWHDHSPDYRHRQFAIAS